jgi:hypothetical protein
MPLSIPPVPDPSNSPTPCNHPDPPPACQPVLGKGPAPQNHSFPRLHFRRLDTARLPHRRVCEVACPPSGLRQETVCRPSAPNNFPSPTHPISRSFVPHHFLHFLGLLHACVPPSHFCRPHQRVFPSLPTDSLSTRANHRASGPVSFFACWQMSHRVPLGRHFSYPCPRSRRQSPDGHFAPVNRSSRHRVSTLSPARWQS